MPTKPADEHMGERVAEFVRSIYDQLCMLSAGDLALVRQYVEQLTEMPSARPVFLPLLRLQECEALGSVDAAQSISLTDIEQPHAWSNAVTTMRELAGLVLADTSPCVVFADPSLEPNIATRPHVSSPERWLDRLRSCETWMRCATHVRKVPTSERHDFGVTHEFKARRLLVLILSSEFGMHVRQDDRLLAAGMNHLYEAKNLVSQRALGNPQRAFPALADHLDAFWAGAVEPDAAQNVEQQVAEADAANLERYFEWRVSVMRDAWTTVDVSKCLGITPQAIRKRLKQKQLLGIKHAGDYRFPVWQFDPNTELGIVRGLTDILASTLMEPLSLAAWMTRPQPTLNDRRPIDALKAGDIEVVLTEARGFGFT